MMTRRTRETPDAAAVRAAALRIAAPAAVVLLLAASCGPRDGSPTHAVPGGRADGAGESRPLILFAGAASQPATAAVAALFERETGIGVDCAFGGSGAVLNQIRIERYGDVYVPGSDDYMDVAERDGLVDPASRRAICYLRPVICVRKGNPLRIAGVKDLAQDGVRLTIGDPGSVCLGAIAMAAFRKAAIQDRVTANIVTYASDCQQVVSLIRLNEVDAAIGYDVFQRQSPDGMDTVPLPEADAVAIPAAAVAFSRQPEKARRFVAFISGPRGKEIFAEYGYSLSPQ